MNYIVISEKDLMKLFEPEKLYMFKEFDYKIDKESFKYFLIEN